MNINLVSNNFSSIGKLSKNMKTKTKLFTQNALNSSNDIFENTTKKSNNKFLKAIGTVIALIGIILSIFKKNNEVTEQSGIKGSDSKGPDPKDNNPTNIDGEEKTHPPDDDDDDDDDYGCDYYHELPKVVIAIRTDGSEVELYQFSDGMLITPADYHFPGGRHVESLLFSLEDTSYTSLTQYQKYGGDSDYEVPTNFGKPKELSTPVDTPSPTSENANAETISAKEQIYKEKLEEIIKGIYIPCRDGGKIQIGEKLLQEIEKDDNATLRHILFRAPSNIDPESATNEEYQYILYNLVGEFGDIKGEPILEIISTFIGVQTGEYTEEWLRDVARNLALDYPDILTREDIEKMYTEAEDCEYDDEYEYDEYDEYEEEEEEEEEYDFA